MNIPKVNLNLQSLTKMIARITLLFCLALSPSLIYANEPPAPGKAISTITGKININSADAPLLSKTLKGIGLKKAIAIVEYRKNYGPFHDIQELSSVSGIGEATVKKISHLIAVK